jgi:hypothetical protein
MMGFGKLIVQILHLTDLRPPNRTPGPRHGEPPIEVLVPDTSRDGRTADGLSTPLPTAHTDSTAGTWSAKMRKTALQ